MDANRLVGPPLACALLVAAALSFAPSSWPSFRAYAAEPDSTTLANINPPVTEPPEVETDPVASPLRLSYDATVASRYLFQGMDLSGGKPVVQPAIVAEYGSVSATVWANYHLDQAVTNEFDFSLEYGVDAGANSFRTGYAHFRYPHRGWEPTHEVLAGFALGLPLSPDLCVHYDFDAGDGAYSTLSLSQPLPGTPLSLGFEIHHQSSYYSLTGFPSSALRLDGEFEVGSWTLAPSLGYSGTWENENFRGENKVDSTWILSFNVAQAF